MRRSRGAISRGNRGKGAALRAGIRVAHRGRGAPARPDHGCRRPARSARAPRALLAALDRADLVDRRSGAARISHAMAPAREQCRVERGGQRVRRTAALPDSQSGYRAIRAAVSRAIAPTRRPLRVRDRLSDPGRARGISHRVRAGADDLRGAEPFSGAARQHARVAGRSCRGLPFGCSSSSELRLAEVSARPAPGIGPPLRFLCTNDDGVMAHGLDCLVRAAEPLGDVTRRGARPGAERDEPPLTLHHPLRARAARRRTRCRSMARRPTA